MIVVIVKCSVLHKMCRHGQLAFILFFFQTFPCKIYIYFSSLHVFLGDILCMYDPLYKHGLLFFFLSLSSVVIGEEEMVEKH